MTHPDRFERGRYAAELRAEIQGDTDRWFSMSQGSFVGVGRLDGAATVIISERGWQVVHHVGDTPVIDTYPTAKEAVHAAGAIAPAVKS